MRWTASLLATTVMSVLLVAPVTAHDHAVPHVRLRAAGDSQDANGYHVWWTRADGDGCVTGEGVGPREFPAPLVVPPGTEKARIRFAKRQRPSELSIVAWRTVDPTGAPVGPSAPVQFELKPKTRDGQRVAWVAVFAAPDAGHYYLQTSVRWEDREGCGGDQGGWWTHHLEVSPI